MNLCLLPVRLFRAAGSTFVVLFVIQFLFFLRFLW